MVTDPEEEARQALREQHGVLAFCRRLAILHCSKLVALAAFAAAMQGQDALGWLFVGEPFGFPNPSPSARLKLEPFVEVYCTDPYSQESSSGELECLCSASLLVSSSMKFNLAGTRMRTHLSGTP